MTTPTPLSPSEVPLSQVIGMTENALGALMRSVLATTGGTFHQWVVFGNVAKGGGAVAEDELVAFVTDTLKIDAGSVRSAVAELVAAGHLRHEAGQVSLTDAGRERYEQLRTAVGAVVRPVTGDLPADDEAATRRVLATIVSRANEHLMARS
jgi:DNA-binding MarR family transcriptional regulator